MNKIYNIISRYLILFKRLLITIIKSYSRFFHRKKTIDSMYATILQNKRREIQSLEKELKQVQLKNSDLREESLTIQGSIDKKCTLIKNLQELIAQRTD